jgi:hypothetical protein
MKRLMNYIGFGAISPVLPAEFLLKFFPERAGYAVVFDLRIAEI